MSFRGWEVNDVKAYKLTAVRGRERRTKTLYADDDLDATFSAMKHILDSACDAPPGSPWRSGRIELRDGSGRLVREMPATEEEEDR